MQTAIVAILIFVILSRGTAGWTAGILYFAIEIKLLDIEICENHSKLKENNVVPKKDSEFRMVTFYEVRVE